MDEMNENKNSMDLDEESVEMKSQSVSEETQPDTMKKQEDSEYDWTLDYIGTNSDSDEKEPERKKSRMLEICVLIFGLLSIVACCFYGLFGIVGVILGIVALVQGKKSGMTIIGLIFSVVGLALSITLWIYSMSDDAKAIKAAYEQYNMERDYGTQQNEMSFGSLKEELEAAVDTSKTKNVISSVEAGAIVLDENTYTIPFDLSELLMVYEISEKSLNELPEVLEPNDTAYLELSKDGVASGISVTVENDTEEILTDIKQASVYSINVSNDADASTPKTSIYNGITFGMTSAEVKEVLQGIRYDEKDMSGYVIYGITAGEDEEFLISIMFKDDIVVCLDIFQF